MSDTGEKGDDTPERGSLGEFSAADRAHGTHGKGDSREQFADDRASKPGNERAAQAGEGNVNPQKLANQLTSELGDAGWGAAASGDSSFDTRSPKKSREEKTGDSQNDRGGQSAARGDE